VAVCIARKLGVEGDTYGFRKKDTFWHVPAPGQEQVAAQGFLGHVRHARAGYPDGEQLERLLEQGPPKQSTWAIGRCIVEYLRHTPVPVSDVKLFDTTRPSLQLLSPDSLNQDSADGWIQSMKRGANLALSTIRHRHGVLARCLEWMLRKCPEILTQNPLRL